MDKNSTIIDFFSNLSDDEKILVINSFTDSNHSSCMIHRMNEIDTYISCETPFRLISSLSSNFSNSEPFFYMKDCDQTIYSTNDVDDYIESVANNDKLIEFICDEASKSSENSIFTKTQISNLEDSINENFASYLIDNGYLTNDDFVEHASWISSDVDWYDEYEKISEIINSAD